MLAPVLRCDLPGPQCPDVPNLPGQCLVQCNPVAPVDTPVVVDMQAAVVATQAVAAVTQVGATQVAVRRFARASTQPRLRHFVPKLLCCLPLSRVAAMR